MVCPAKTTVIKMKILLVLLTFSFYSLGKAQSIENHRDLHKFDVEYEYDDTTENVHDETSAEVDSVQNNSNSLEKREYRKCIPPVSMDVQNNNPSETYKIIIKYNSGQINSQCGISNFSKMIGNGKIVRPPFKYPWMVALQKKDGQPKCGGAIISDQYILTAAHCLSIDSSSEIQIAFVTNTFALSQGAEVMDIKIHPQYRHLNEDHDIALLKLRKRIRFNIYRRPISLPSHGMEVNIGQEFITAGWGSRIGGSPNSSPHLKETVIKMVDFSNCYDRFSHLEENFYCLKGVNMSGPCHGDSGGPMFAEFQRKFYIFGVASMHCSQTCNPRDAFLYTKITTYLDWINSYVHQ